MMSFSIRSAICTKIGRFSSIKFSIALSLTWLVTHVTNYKAKDVQCQVVTLHLLTGFVQGAQFERVWPIVKLQYVGAMVHEKASPSTRHDATRDTGKAYRMLRRKNRKRL